MCKSSSSDVKKKVDIWGLSQETLCLMRQEIRLLNSNYAPVMCEDVLSMRLDMIAINDSYGDVCCDILQSDKWYQLFLETFCFHLHNY